MGILGKLHEHLVIGRRAEVLSTWFSQLAPQGARVLDVGCGDGLLSSLIAAKRRDLVVCGVDVLVREKTFVPVKRFDGKTIPYEAGSFDAVLFSDVLHHTTDPKALLLEGQRVATQCILLKDHYRTGFAAALRLRFMDWTGNARFGVPLPYNYWAEDQWQQSWHEVGLFPDKLITRLRLYPEPFDRVFGARLHFITRLRKEPVKNPEFSEP